MPPPTTSSDGPFIGRKRELGLLADWYEGTRKLLTVVGPPGVGKSRLVQEYLLPEDHLRHWFSLAELDDANQLVDALSSTLSLTGPVELDRLAPALDAYGPSLVVLDNMEHLLPEGAALVDQLVQATAPEIKILSTSRQRLLLPGETVLEMQGLSLEPEKDGWSDAAQCFVVRAQMTQASYQPSEEEHGAIEALARFLDGIPLALELAAGRLSLLPAQEILARLTDHFELLAHGTSRDKRHRTMQAAVAWSWSLLSEDEQRALELLAVAEQVTMDEAARLFDCDTMDAIGRLQSLRDSSLVKPVHTGGATGFTPYEVVRSFVLHSNRLDPDATARLQAGVLRFISLCAERSQQLVQRFIAERSKAILQECKRSQPNLLRAMAYLQAIDAGAQRLRAPLPANSSALGLYGQQIATILLMLAAYLPVSGLAELYPLIARWPRDHLDTQTRSLLECHLAYFARQRLSQSEASLRLNQEVEARAETLQVTPETAEVWNLLAMASINRAQPDEQLLTKAAEASQASGSIAQQAMATMLAGNRLYLKGDYRNAIKEFERAESLARQAGADILTAKSLVNLALALGADSQLEGSLSTTRKAVVAARDAGILTSAAWSQKVLADSAFAAGALDLAIRSYNDCIQSLRRIGARDAAAFAMHTLSRALLERGDEDQAGLVCRQLDQYVQKANFDLHGDHLGYLKGLIALTSGHYADAARHLQEALNWVVSSQEGYRYEIESLALLARELSEPSEVTREEAHEFHNNLPSDASRHLLTTRLNLATLSLSGPEPALDAILKELKTLIEQCRANRHWSIRESLRRVLSRLPADARQELLQHAIDPDGEALLLDVKEGILGGSRPPHGSWIDLSSRATLGGVLLALAEASRSGEALGVYELAEAAWPNEAIAPEAASNRVYNAIATLRKKGFRDVIQKGDDGYELAAPVKYLEVVAIWPEIDVRAGSR